LRGLGVVGPHSCLIKLFKQPGLLALAPVRSRRANEHGQQRDKTGKIRLPRKQTLADMAVKR
jgi:hypothetical protein